MREFEGKSMRRRLLCVARGCDGDWEAICLDLDVAVQGESLDDVRSLLNQAICTYFEDARKEDDETRIRLVNRRVPFLTRLGYVLQLARHTLACSRDGDGLQASFEIPCHA
jgi:hypothetical protein